MTQAEEARAAIKAAESGAAPAAPAKPAPAPAPTAAKPGAPAAPAAPAKASFYTKVDPGKAARFSLTTPLEILPEGQDASPAAIEKFIADSAATWDAAVPKFVPEAQKAVEAAAAAVDSNLEQAKLLKEKSLGLMEERKKAIAGADKAKTEAINDEITRNSRLLLASRRLAHLSSLEALLYSTQLSYLLTAAPAESKAKAAVEGKDAAFAELAKKAADAVDKAKGLRPRTKAAATPDLKRPAAAMGKLPAGAGYTAGVKPMPGMPRPEAARPEAAPVEPSPESSEP
jgi:hypothetical protein